MNGKRVFNLSSHRFQPRFQNPRLRPAWLFQKSGELFILQNPEIRVERKLKPLYGTIQSSYLDILKKFLCKQVCSL